MLEFIRFELRYRLRQPALWLFAAVYALLTFGATTSDAVQIGGSFGQTAIDAPYVVTSFLSILSVVSVFVVVAFTASTVVRDYDQKTYDLFYTKPIRKVSFLLGRFLGGTMAATLVMGGASLGLAIGRLMPWLEPDRIVGFRAGAHVSAFALFVIPNFVIMGAVFFCLATLTRRMMWAYVGVVGFFVLYGIAGSFISDLDNDLLAALADPFAINAFTLETRYWTPAERNTLLVPFDGVVAVNRILWLSISAGFLAFTTSRVSLQSPEVGRKTRTPVSTSDESRVNAEIPAVSFDFSLRGRRTQLLHLLRVEIRSVLRSTPFLVICFFTAVNTFVQARGTIGDLFGTPVYPVTYLMLRVLDGSMGLFLLIVVTFYAGELVWRERKSHLAEVFWALPVPNWAVLSAKLMALMTAVVALSVVGMLTTMVVQLVSGYTQFELGLYASDVFGLSLAYWLLFSVLAFFFQVIANHRYVGYGLVAVFFIAQIALPELGLEHDLYVYGASPTARYSDMNGYGQFLGPAVLFKAHWTWAALIIALISNLFWVRGTDSRLRMRIRGARARIDRVNTLLLVVATAGMAASGGWTFYNTNVLNDYRTSDDALDEAERYEREYKQYESLPQPRLVGTSVEVDLFPHQRRLELRGHHRLRNDEDVAIDTVHVMLNPDVRVIRLELSGATLEHHDEALGYRIFRLADPLAPSAEIELQFELTYGEVGIPLGSTSTSIVQNGTFFHGGEFDPSIGYDKGKEISDPNERSERGLPERPRMPALGDEAARRNTYISASSDWIDFEATISTSADQTALAPGYLVKSWRDGDRAYFEYRPDGKILNLWAIMSARYEVHRDRWNDVGIDIYFHQPHDYNIERMVYAVQKSLDYYTEHFGPYQHRQIRIVEFPRYASYAQSLPNIIPYSEAIGFIADLRDAEDVDYVFYVTAHEMAHQWWAHQLIGADMQGSTLMSETLSQYSALMVMEQEYGPDKMRKFLAYELDQYLIGRATESDRELPLLEVENQPYIHYNKGSLAMYALRDYAGEDVVNAMLAKYLRDRAYQPAPFTTAREFVDRIHDAVPDELDGLVEDYFEKIVLYDNRVERATARPTADSQWAVTLELRSVKYEADESGAEKEVPMNDLIEIGVFGEDEAGEDVELLREKRKLSSGTSLVEVVVPTQPVRAGIDPRVLLVDRNPEDNVKSVKTGS